MIITKVISKSKNGKMECIGEENGISRTLHVIVEGDKFKFFDGYEYKPQTKKAAEIMVTLLMGMPIVPELVKTKIPKYRYATMKG